jgi:hypothetical protein
MDADGKKFTLLVDIQEGFNDDTVIIKVNGKDVFTKEHVTTSLLAGPAASFSTKIESRQEEGSRLIVTALVPTRNNLQDSHELDLENNSNSAGEIYLGISIIGGGELSGYGKEEKIRFIASDHPFGYM